MTDDIDDLDKNVLEVIAKQSPTENNASLPVALKIVDRKRAEKQKTQKKANNMKATEKTTPTHQKSIAGSMDRLAKVVRQLVVFLSDLQKDTKTEKTKLWKKLEDLETQNEKIARGILAVADLVREQQAKHEDVEEAKKPQTPPPRMSMNDLRLPGMQAPQMQMPDRLPERQPLFLNKMPQFRETPMQFQQPQQQFPPVQQQVNFPQPPIQQFKMPDLPLPMIKEGDEKEKDELMMG